MKEEGLFGKYIIKKADGSPIAKNADYFVLRLDKDKPARKAIFAGLIPIPDMLEEEIKDNVKKESRSKHKK